MSKRLLLKSVLFVSTVAPVMASYAADIPNQNSGIFTQESNKAADQSSVNSSSIRKDSAQDIKTNTGDQTVRSNTKPEDTEEMD